MEKKVNMLSPTPRMTSRRVVCKVLVAVAVLLLLCDGVSGANTKVPQVVTTTEDRSKQPAANGHVEEYKALYSITDDKEGLESIRFLHEQLDDDNDGTIEPSETGDFIRVDLHPGSKTQQQTRQKSFHKKDTEITVKDLWQTWWRSEVHNWTVDQTIEWLDKSCELSQYSEQFRKHKVTGSKLPLVAVGGSFLNKVLGITNPIHRSKITLKAMDVVLFGPPKDSSSMIKDIIFTCILIVAMGGFGYAYRQNNKSKEHLRRLMNDMEALADAEKELKELQKMSRQDDKKINSYGDDEEGPDPLEVHQLRQEVDILRTELQRAEVELEDKCWMAPPVLQHWLQLTYELESMTYNAKRKAAEDQLELAKDMCDKLKKKRSSLVGAFVSTHGRSIDDVDKNILDAKMALMEVTKDLQERTTRWRQVEMLCGVQIMINPGINVLKHLVRHVGVGRSGQMGGSRLSNSPSQDNLLEDNIDAHSVAASSHMTTSSQLRERPSILGALPGSSAASVSGLSTKGRRSKLAQMSRESSKESSSSADDLTEKRTFPHILGPSSIASSMAARTPPMPSSRKISPRIGPNGRMMVKSLSQDAASPMAATAASVIQAAASTASNSNVSAAPTGSMANSVSDTHLTSSQMQQQPSIKPNVLTAKPPLPHSSSSTSMASSIAASPTLSLQPSESLSTSASQPALRPPTVTEESCSDSGSLASADLDANGKKTKKKRSFFNFRRKKEKIP